MDNDTPKDFHEHLEKWVEVKKILGVPEGTGLIDAAWIIREFVGSARMLRTASTRGEQDYILKHIDDSLDALDSLPKFSMEELHGRVVRD